MTRIMASGYDIQRQPRHGRHVVSGLHEDLDFPVKSRRGMPGDDMLSLCERVTRKTLRRLRSQPA